MYCRADLSRTITLVVALFLTAVSTGGSAREFRAAGTQGSLVAERSDRRLGGIDFNRTNVALIGSMVPATKVPTMPFRFRSIEHPREADIDRRPFEAAMAGLYVRAKAGPAMAQLIERIRKVE